MRVITLNSEVFSKTCKELFSKLALRPNLVVAIVNGGTFVLKEINKDYALQATGLAIINKKVNFKDGFLMNLILKNLPYFFLDRLRILESNLVRRRIKKNDDVVECAEISIELSLDTITEKEVNNILIVDDALDSGKTMLMVKNNLSSKFPKAKIESAVISWTLKDSIIKPDYYIFKDLLVRFPWSVDYKGKDFEK